MGVSHESTSINMCSLFDAYLEKMEKGQINDSLVLLLCLIDCELSIRANKLLNDMVT